MSKFRPDVHWSASAASTRRSESACRRPSVAQPARELGARQGVEQPDHAHGDRRVLDAAHHLPRHVGRLRVEAEDEPGVHVHPGVVDLAHARDDVAPDVLRLARAHERRLVRRLDADEDREEARAPHEGQQLVTIGQVEAGLGRVLERVAVSLAPVRQGLEERLDRLRVADEVVVHEIDVAAVAERVQRLELRGASARWT